MRFRDGTPAGVEPFVKGFLTDGGSTHIARPVGLTVAKDGSLLMADDANGVIYRIAYNGGTAAGAALPPPHAAAMKAQTSKGLGVPLAAQRPETRTTGPARIDVKSTAFNDGSEIPLKYSEYADGLSPALGWSAVPNAKSYVVVMEDPDAKPITPFVHWVAYNIPPTTTQLPGLAGADALDRAGRPVARQDQPWLRYYGPRPPVGDAPHRYHFQVLALDTVLDVPPPGADRDQVLAAARGHVMAKGMLTGRYGQLQQPLK